MQLISDRCRSDVVNLESRISRNSSAASVYFCRFDVGRMSEVPLTIAPHLPIHGPGIRLPSQPNAVSILVVNT